MPIKAKQVKYSSTARTRHRSNSEVTTYSDFAMTFIYGSSRARTSRAGVEGVAQAFADEVERYHGDNY